MGKVEFHSQDEAMEFLEKTREQNRKVGEILAPEQKAVTWGSCWVRFWEDLAIFGRVLTVDELIDAESEGIPEPNGDPDHDAEVLDAAEEVAQIVATIIKAEADDYVYGWCHSKIEPGEPGSTHRGNLWGISDALFQHAAENDWDPDRFRPIFRLELANTYKHYFEWATSVAAGVQEAEKAIDKAAEVISGGDPHEPR